MSYLLAGFVAFIALVLLVESARSAPAALAQQPSPVATLMPSASAPTGTLSASVPSTAATNQLLSFTAGAAGTGDLAWAFGDGATATGSSVTHAYRSAGTFSVTVSANATAGAVGSDSHEVLVTDSIVLQPGNSITFASPSPLPLPIPSPAPGGAPPSIPRGGFVAQNLLIENQTDQLLTASYAYDTSRQPTDIRDAELELALPDGYALQVVTPHFSGLSVTSLRGCAVDGNTASQASCSVGTSASGSPLLHYTVRAAPAGDVQDVMLPKGGAAALLGPQEPGASPNAVAVASMSDQATTITWDGSTLSITAPDGYAVSEQGARDLSSFALVPIDCAAPDSSPNSLDCSLSGAPRVEVQFTTFARAPSGMLQLAYSDDSGPGTLTIANTGPDVAPGGATIDATLVQPGVMLTGSGVMRPQAQTGTYLLAFDLADTDGNSYLFQAQIASAAGAYSGRGLWLDEADETQAGIWTVGTPAGTTQPYASSGISLAPPPMVPGGGANPGTPLPSYTGSQLIGAVSPQPGPPGVAMPPFGPVEPPVIGAAGQPLSLIAITGLPSSGPIASPTWQWSFGDGTMNESTSQTVTHAWVEPGLYTVAVVITDRSGASTFALTQIQIAP